MSETRMPPGYIPLTIHEVNPSHTKLNGGKPRSERHSDGGNGSGGYGESRRGSGSRNERGGKRGRGGQRRSKEWNGGGRERNGKGGRDNRDAEPRGRRGGAPREEAPELDGADDLEGSDEEWLDDEE